MWGRLNLRDWLAIGQPTVALRLQIHYTDQTMQSIQLFIIIIIIIIISFCLV
jgi:hypothetical protein